MKRQPIGTEENSISPETLRRFSLGLLEDDEAQRVAAYLEKFPSAAAEVEAIEADSFLRKMREAGGDTISSLADSTSRGTPLPQESAVPVPVDRRAQEFPMQSDNASTIPNLHPELAALAQYRFIKELGAGGMSLVYLAENLHMGGRKEALKILNASQMRQAGAKERFDQEIAVAANLNHPHVVTAYSAMRLPSLAVFVMQYVEGQDLEQYVRAKGPLRIAVACGIIRQVASGLQYAMDMKTIHRDIKPANLMLTKTGSKDVVKILDFGLAKAQMESDENEGLTSTGMGMGTPHYMAPEQLLSADKADIRADIYSLGCTMYFLLAGRPPFTGTQYEIYHAHQSQEATPLNLLRPDVPIELATVVAKMMARQPAKRYQRPEEIIAALTPFLHLREAAPGATNDSIVPTMKSVAAVAAGPVAPQHTQIETVPHVAGAALVDTTPEHQSLVRPAIDITVPKASPLAKQPGRSNTDQWKLIVGSALAGLALMVLLGMAAGVFRVRTADGIIVFERLPADAVVLVDGRQVVVQWDNDKERATVEIKPGTRNVEVQRGGVKVEGMVVTVSAGEETQLVVRAEQEQPLPNQTAKTTNPTSPAASASRPNMPPTKANDDQWTSLFDGSDTSAWLSLGPFFVKDGMLTAPAGQGNAVSRSAYGDFELVAEWIITKGANGGIYYRETNTDGITSGNEYQIVDDSDFRKALTPERQTGSLYGVIAPSTVAVRPVGEWNTSRIVCQGTTVEHWLNDRLLLGYDTSGDEWKRVLAASTETGIGARQRGYILLQKITGNIAFRSIRIRELAPRQIPDDATTYQGHSYKFFAEWVTWKKAKSRCEEMGGHLPIVETEAENRFLTQVAENGFPGARRTGQEAVWLGMSDEAVEGDWRWLDGTRLSYTNWYKNQPNNKQSQEHFGILTLLDEYNKLTWTWCDQPNQSEEHLTAFICEWDGAKDIVGETPPSTSNSFFNGRDLTGWKRFATYWTVADGVLVGTTKPTGINVNACLVSDKEYEDFELTCKVKLSGDATVNSGIQFRSVVLEQTHFPMEGPQCDIGQKYWGSLYREGSGMMQEADKAVVAKVLKEGEFNELYLSCVGQRVVIKLNGQTTVDKEFPELPSRGRIGWQLHRGTGFDVFIKDIEFKEHSKAPVLR